MIKILIIDDDIVMRAIIREALEPDGYEIMEAPNGKVGLKLHMKYQFPLIITDIIMPDMEGLETIRAIKGIDKATKIIAISGGGTQDADGYLQIAKKLGAHSILEKPFKKEDISVKVKNLLKF